MDISVEVAMKKSVAHKRFFLIFTFALEAWVKSAASFLFIAYLCCCRGIAGLRRPPEH